MKKIFSVFAAAFMSAAAFAQVTPAVVPSDADFNAYKADGANVVVGFYTEAPVCNDIVFAGTYNDWSTDVETCVVFEEMEGFENWYVCSFNDASASIAGKPLQLKNGSFSGWDYQIGDDATVVRGTATIAPGYSGEVNITDYGTDAPVVLASAKWKLNNNPCETVPTHEYTVILNAPFCADAEGNYFDPAIIGAFNGWSEGVAMILNEEDFTYSYTFTDEEKHEFKFKAVGDTDWTNQIQLYDAENDVWYDNNNIGLGEETTIVIDYSEGRYTLCVEEPTALENVEVKAAAVKAIENGRLVIKMGEKKFTVLGAEL